MNYISFDINVRLLTETIKVVEQKYTIIDVFKGGGKS